MAEYILLLQFNEDDSTRIAESFTSIEEIVNFFIELYEECIYRETDTKSTKMEIEGGENTKNDDTIVLFNFNEIISFLNLLKEFAILKPHKIKIKEINANEINKMDISTLKNYIDLVYSKDDFAIEIFKQMELKKLNFKK